MKLLEMKKEVWFFIAIICCLSFFKVTCEFFSAIPFIVGRKGTKTFSNWSIFFLLLLMYDLKNYNKKNFWVASTPHWWVLSLYMLVYSYLPSVLKALTSLLTDSLVTWLSDWPVRTELTTWAMTTGWLTDGLIICLTVFRTLHLASGHGYY